MNKSAVGKVKLSYQHACIECRTLAEGTYPLGMCRLHASAQELLEALKLAYKALDTDTEQNPQDTILMETIECAIAKAEGRT